MTTKDENSAGGDARRDASRGGRQRNTLSQSRRYHPRGQSVRDAAESDDRRRRVSTRRNERDAFSPALRLVEGGAARTPPRRTAAARQRTRLRVAETPIEAPPVARSAKARAAQRQSAVRTPPQPRRGGPSRRVIKRKLPRIANPRRRLRLGTVLILIMFVIAGGRLVQLQVTDAAAYAADALQQRLYTEVVPASRGSITDRNGELLAFSVNARFVYADPEMVEDAGEAAAMLSPLLGIPASKLEPKMQRQEDDEGNAVRFVYLARGVDATVGDTIAELGIPGVRVRADERREVPGHDLAANLIGFTGTDGNGLAGFEATYEDVLRGDDGELTYEVSGSGQKIPGGFQREEAAQPGDDLQLTIDSDLQYQVQKILAKTVEEKNAQFGAAVVMDVKTGEVVSIASAPTYDAADPFGYDEKLRVDWASGAVVEPGSIHKALVVGAALEEGLISRDDLMTVAPTIQVAETTYRDTHYHDERPMSLGGILAHSSNVGIIMLAQQLGPEKLYEYQRKFGLGSPTDAGIAGEAAGIVRPASDWYGSDHGSIPIGLGVAVTPLQMAAGYSAIANDGMYVQPSLVECRVAPDGRKTSVGDPDKHRLFSASTARDLQHLLQAPITVPDGTGTIAELPGYLVAGKTGTGQLVRDGEYAPGEVASFVGFAPADKPKYTVAVFAYTPGGGGGTVTGTAFRDIMQVTLGHFRVPPSQEEPAKFEVYG
ncbi:peptidoglycan D,D-transpeptidase FtsI family protein [Stackebrandtia soli]|uniref:peptidoglycan D,D-transpeptidase FtsI family protein n=1 Tax=Stackebrandtia soli TaxID=1892856 RepID=UPI0039EA6E9E